MPTAATGVYELVLSQLYLGQTITNVFQYLHTLGTDDEQLLCINAWEDDIAAPLQAVQSDTLAYTNIRCANLTGSLADVNVTPTLTVGALPGSEMASFVAAPFRYVRTTKETRNGSKRFAGMIEENTLDQGFTAAYVIAMNSFATVLATVMSVPGGIFTPIIISKPPAVGPIYTFNDVQDVQFLNRLSTQNTRKSF